MTGCRMRKGSSILFTFIPIFIKKEKGNNGYQK